MTMTLLSLTRDATGVRPRRRACARRLRLNLRRPRRRVPERENAHRFPWTARGASTPRPAPGRLESAMGFRLAKARSRADASDRPNLSMNRGESAIAKTLAGRPFRVPVGVTAGQTSGQILRLANQTEGRFAANGVGALATSYGRTVSDFVFWQRLRSTKNPPGEKLRKATDVNHIQQHSRNHGRHRRPRRYPRAPRRGP